MTWCGFNGTRLRNAAAGALLLGLAVLSAAHAAEAPVVFQSTDTPPFWSPALPEQGVGGRILRLLSAAAGVDYKIDYLPVKRFRQSTAPYIVGDPDILIAQKRRAVFPIALFHSAFFYYNPHHEAIDFRSLEDLRGHTLGVLRGTVEDKSYFIEHDIRVEESDSVESLLKKLQRGRVDVCILVDATALHAIDKLFPAEKEHFVEVTIPGSERPIALLIDIDDPQAKMVAQRYRKVLESTLQSQEYAAIVREFYGSRPMPVDRAQHLQKFERIYAIDWEQ